MRALSDLAIKFLTGFSSFPIINILSHVGFTFTVGYKLSTLSIMIVKGRPLPGYNDHLLPYMQILYTVHIINTK